MNFISIYISLLNIEDYEQGENNFPRFCENNLEQIPLLFQMFLRIWNFLHSNVFVS